MQNGIKSKKCNFDSTWRKKHVDSILHGCLSCWINSKADLKLAVTYSPGTKAINSKCTHTEISRWHRAHMLDAIWIFLQYAYCMCKLQYGSTCCISIGPNESTYLNPITNLTPLWIYPNWLGQLVYPNHWGTRMHPHYWGSWVHPKGRGSWMHPNGWGNRVWPSQGRRCADLKLAGKLKCNMYSILCCNMHIAQISILHLTLEHSLRVGWRNFFPVVPLCQYFGCGGKWFLVLHSYLEYNTKWHIGIGIWRGQMTDRWLHMDTLI